MVISKFAIFKQTETGNLIAPMQFLVAQSNQALVIIKAYDLIENFFVTLTKFADTIAVICWRVTRHGELTTLSR